MNGNAGFAASGPLVSGRNTARREHFYRGRFAPSPTGPLHFGSLIAAVASYCDARHATGDWLLRIEDVDLPRMQAGAEGHILHTLERYGFAWDGPVVRQSARSAIYAEALAALRAGGFVFDCVCTRRDLANAEAGNSGEPIYPGTCRGGLRGTAARHPTGLHAARVRVGSSVIAFTDRLQGPQQQDLARDVGDFVVLRADGLFAYQLAVVVDDAAQGVTDIVRGADLLSSTARQIYLQRCLGLATPRYLHVPVAVDVRGNKLSKQTLAQPLSTDPMPALLAAWAFLDQPPFDRAPLNVAEFWSLAIETWNAQRLPPVAMLPSPRTLAPQPQGAPARSRQV